MLCQTGRQGRQQDGNSAGSAVATREERLSPFGLIAKQDRDEPIALQGVNNLRSSALSQNSVFHTLIPVPSFSQAKSISSHSDILPRNSVPLTRTPQDGRPERISHPGRYRDLSYCKPCRRDVIYQRCRTPVERTRRAGRRSGKHSTGGPQHRQLGKGRSRQPNELAVVEEDRHRGGCCIHYHAFVSTNDQAAIVRLKFLGDSCST